MVVEDENMGIGKDDRADLDIVITADDGHLVRGHVGDQVELAGHKARNARRQFRNRAERHLLGGGGAEEVIVEGFQRGRLILAMETTL